MPPKRFLAWFGRNQVNFFKVRLCTDAFLRRKAERCFACGGFLVVLGGNRLSTAMCNPIYRLFGIEKVAKDFRGSNAAAKAWLREDFARQNPFCPSESSKTLVSHCPQNCDAKSPRDRRADMWFCTKQNYFRQKCYFSYNSNSQQDLLLQPARCREMTTAECKFYVWLVCGKVQV